jgi:tetraacyldisaccharide 4'-kinase
MIRSRLEPFLNRRWYGRSRPGSLLRLLERLYRRAFERRRRQGLANLASDLNDRAIVVVGNITAGGTGKTPVVIRLCRLLADAGYSVGVVSRGYGRRQADLIVVDGSQPLGASGDEPRLIFERCGVPVAVGPDRVAAARHLFETGVDVVVSDDGLQHWRMPRVYEICVIDGQRALGNGHWLPAGPLREGPGRLKTVDAVIITDPAGPLPEAPGALEMVLWPGQPVSLREGRSMETRAWVDAAGQGLVYAVAGIGNPERFFRTLESLDIPIQRRAFPDHHEYTARDFFGFEGARIIMTEKDAVKCRHLDLADAWYLPVDARLPLDWERSFLAELEARIRAEPEHE